jgi:hypothetical protein
MTCSLYDLGAKALNLSAQAKTKERPAANIEQSRE